jgi:hypothetical protein
MIKTFGSLIGRTRLLSIVLLTDIPGFPETLSGPNARTIPSSTSFREAFAFLIQRSGIFARNLRSPRTTEPELETNYFGSLGIKSRLLDSSEMPCRFPLRLPGSQPVEKASQC